MLRDNGAKLLKERRDVLQGILDLTDRAASILVPRVLHRLIAVGPRLVFVAHVAACMHVLSRHILRRLDFYSPLDIDTFLRATITLPLVFLDSHKTLALCLLRLNHLLVLLQALLEGAG